MVTEQQRNAPKPRRADERINYAAEERALASKEIGDQIELEKADQSPVDGADDRCV